MAGQPQYLVPPGAQRTPALSDAEAIAIMRAPSLQAAVDTIAAAQRVSRGTVSLVRRHQSKRYVALAIQAGLITTPPARRGEVYQTAEDLLRHGWTDDELDWARECLTAGDSVAEIARWSNREPDDVRAALCLPREVPLSLDQARLVELWNEGGAADAIADELGWTENRVRQMVASLRRRGVGVAFRPPGSRLPPRPPRPPRPPDYTVPLTELEQRVLASYLAGYADSHIRRWEGLRSRGAVAGLIFRARKKARAQGLQADRSPALLEMMGE